MQIPLLDFSSEERNELMHTLIQRLESYYAHTKSLAVAPVLDRETIIQAARKFDFNHPVNPREALLDIIGSLEKFTVHTSHPAYFGLFNPRSNFAGIMADLISAAFNIQLAAWSHAPFAAEAENYLIQVFGEKFGYAPGSIDGVFATGGAEANQTAVLCALNHHFPEFASAGLRGMARQPMIYCSAEAHHSIVKAARTSGLGSGAVRSIPVAGDLRMDLQILENAIIEDIRNGKIPFMVTGTAGTTGPGAIDDLPAISAICKKYNLWFHVDAAYGGAVVVHPVFKKWLKGIEESQSVTFDIHKWLSVPMACSMFITSQKDILSQTFSISTGYMPRDANRLPVTDPFTHSIQWSRRFIGFKLYLSMVMFGWEGYAQTIEHQIHMGNYLRQQLLDSGWVIKNHSMLPIVCFADMAREEEEGFVSRVCEFVVKSGKAWISVFPVKGRSCLRACITNYGTTETEIRELIQLLHEARAEVGKGY
ncbi:MAG: pyridoxal-dependent decarboxylase [Bacteroidia bacterium]